MRVILPIDPELTGRAKRLGPKEHELVWVNVVSQNLPSYLRPLQLNEPDSMQGHDMYLIRLMPIAFGAVVSPMTDGLEIVLGFLSGVQRLFEHGQNSSIDALKQIVFLHSEMTKAEV